MTTFSRIFDYTYVNQKYRYSILAVTDPSALGLPGEQPTSLGLSGGQPPVCVCWLPVMDELL